MKPRLVFVHGIGGPRDTAAELDGWMGALAKGAAEAGHSRRVPGLLRGASADARFAYYGDLFAVPQVQGAAAPKDREAADVRALLSEALDEREAAGAGARDLDVLRHARAQLAPQGPAQGIGSIARQILGAANTLLALPGLRKIGQWASGRLMVGQLAQVTRYLARGETDATGHTLDERVRRRVLEALDPETPTVVVAHSLGTVVALEVLSTYPGRIPLLVTLGSPIGLRATVGLRMRPQPPRVPDQVMSWVNLWDRDDLVVGRPELEDFVAPNAHGVPPDSRRVDSAGAWVHPALKYLAHPGTAGPVMEALETGGPS